MNRARVGGLVAAAVLVLLLGVWIGTHMATSGGTATPALPTATSAPAATSVSVPAGLGTRYYESDNGDNGRVELHYVGGQVLAQVSYDLGLGANPVYTGTVAGTTLVAKAPSLPSLHNPGADDTLTVRVTRPGQAEVTLAYPKNDVGVATAGVHFAATCGIKTDAYRYQSCRPLTKP